MSRASEAEKLHNFLKDLESQPEEESKQVLKEKLSRLQQDKEALTLQVMVNYSKSPIVISYRIFPANVVWSQFTEHWFTSIGIHLKASPLILYQHSKSVQPYVFPADSLQRKSRGRFD